MPGKKKCATVRIVNAEPGDKYYTSSKSAEGLVRRGIAAWTSPATDTIVLLPLARVQRLSIEAQKQLAEEHLIGRNTTFDWHPKMSGGVKVWQARKLPPQWGFSKRAA